ncbi:hypothetical protein GCM10010156_66380 [Planobispora rosea]|uniref:Uncharacterized protein n=1 Tax=Planobispora rosea TaxID=35762 RepID=A0A8J3S405_PLARO|nr:hypothetical protein [Planobispora rosea]GGS98970.1 hypothetical protein GCM10010156_66380 [Planobispora rosea]GIH88001.1 hypothetical protein Pro02_64090 [Planobispora rosea]
MTSIDVLTLVLAVSVAVNIGCAAGFITLRTGSGWARAVLAAGGAVGAALVIFFAAVGAYSDGDRQRPSSGLQQDCLLA